MYPEAVPHCDVCRWLRECDEQRRGDDHLSLVAGIRRQQREQLVAWGTETMAKLAGVAIPLKERANYGAGEGIEKVREEARVALAGSTKKRVRDEATLPVAGGMGCC